MAFDITSNPSSSFWSDNSGSGSNGVDDKKKNPFGPVPLNGPQAPNGVTPPDGATPPSGVPAASGTGTTAAQFAVTPAMQQLAATQAPTSAPAALDATFGKQGNGIQAVHDANASVGNFLGQGQSSGESPRNTVQNGFDKNGNQMSIKTDGNSGSRIITTTAEGKNADGTSDGSSTISKERRDKDNNLTMTSTLQKNADGSSTSSKTTYGKDGQVSSVIEGKQDKDGNTKEVTKDKDGQVLSEYQRKENADGSSVSLRKNADGSMEKKAFDKDGNLTIMRQAADGTKSVSREDAQGNPVAAKPQAPEAATPPKAPDAKTDTKEGVNAQADKVAAQSKDGEAKPGSLGAIQDQKATIEAKAKEDFAKTDKAKLFDGQKAETDATIQRVSAKQPQTEEDRKYVAQLKENNKNLDFQRGIAEQKATQATLANDKSYQQLNAAQQKEQEKVDQYKDMKLVDIKDGHLLSDKEISNKSDQLFDKEGKALDKAGLIEKGIYARDKVVDKTGSSDSPSAASSKTDPVAREKAMKTEAYNSIGSSINSITAAILSSRKGGRQQGQGSSTPFRLASGGQMGNRAQR